MALKITQREFNQLRDFIEQNCGIMLGDEKAYLVETRLMSLARENKCSSFGELYEKLCSASKLSTIFGSMVDAITTNETLWFRDTHPYEIMIERMFSEYQKEIEEGRRSQIKIWSAACSTGQEPYSIAMKILDYIEQSKSDTLLSNRVKIIATDISPSALLRAREGKYTSTAMGRGLPVNYLKKYFRKENNDWIISDQVKGLVEFRQLNLKDAAYGSFGPFDIVFLRNVIIYFSDVFKAALLDRITRYMSPEGYMFLGAGETVSGYGNRFEILNHKGSLFYRVIR